MPVAAVERSDRAWFQTATRWDQPTVSTPLREAAAVLNSGAVRDGSAGSETIAHLLESAAKGQHHFQPRVSDFELAFGRLLSHERDVLGRQLRAAVTPENRQLLRDALANCAGGLLCELLKAILL